ncbi:MAG: ComF family protein [Chloroflexota bacterium]
MSLASILELVLPPSCAGCGAFGALLCRRCVGALRPARDAEVAFLATDASVLAGIELDLVMAAFRHDGAARRALQRLKYGGAARLAATLATASLSSFDELLAISGPATLVPVPVNVARLRERGYNQALLLARALGAARALPVAEVLARSRATIRQHGLDRSARLANLRAAFTARRAPMPRRIILVDDILTTGATVEACASVLRAAGASQVYGFAIAREV